MEIGFAEPGLLRARQGRDIVVPLDTLPRETQDLLKEGDMVIVEPKVARLQGVREPEPWDDERGPDQDPWEKGGLAPEEEPLETWFPRCVAHVRDQQIVVPVMNPYSTEARLPTANDVLLVEKLVPDLASMEELLPPPHQHIDKVKLKQSREKFVSALKELMERYPFPPKVPGISMAGCALTAEEQTFFQYALSTVQGVFAETDTDFGTTQLVTHSIDTGTAPPMRHRPYRVPFKFRERMEKLLADMLEQGVVEPSSSPWASPVVLVRKHDGSLRFCVDYRRLNAVTRKDSYPLPRIDELLDSLNGARYFTKMDLQSGFWQIPLSKGARAKTAFTCHEGLFQFRHMPFGLTNAPATFQRLMDCVLSGLNGMFCLVFLDDIIIFTTTTAEQHMFDVLRVLQALKSEGLKVKGRKCSFACEKLQFLGHEVSREGIRPDPEKVRAVRECPPPKNQTGVRSFLGLTGFYRRFIFMYAWIVFPIVALLKKGAEFVWTTACQEAFEKLKDALTSAPILVYPSLQKPFVVATDASGEGIGAVLSQEGEDGQMHVVAYASRTLRKYEAHYAAVDAELLAVVWALSYFRPYLLGAKFRIITDHQASVWLLKKQFSTSMGFRKTRWAILLSEYDYEITYRPGSQNGNADALSRAPIVQAPPSKEHVEFDPAEYNDCGEEGTAELGYEVGGRIMPDVTPTVVEGMGPQETTLAESPISEREIALEKRADGETKVKEAEEPLEGPVEKNPSACGPDPQLLCDALSAITDTIVVTGEEYSKMEQTPEGRAVCRGMLDAKSALGLPDIVDNTGCATVECFQFPMTLPEQIKEDQMQDPFCGAMLAFKQNGDLPEDDKLAREVSSFNHYFTVASGLLYRVRRSRTRGVSGEEPTGFEQLVVPRKLVDVLVASYHSGLGGGHFGPEKLFQTISRRYYWKNGYEDIRNFCRTCTLCGKYNEAQRTRARLYPLKVHGPFERVEVDFEGPLPQTPSGNKHILVFSDCFTKWPIAVAVPDATAETAARAFMEQVVLQHGCPLELLSDKGPAFRAAMCERICAKLGVHKTFSMPYHHQTMGHVERLNKTLQEMLRKSLDDDAEELWDEHLPYALFAYRVAVHASTRDTPFHMLYGRDPVLPVDLLMQPLVEEEEDGGYPERMQANMQRAWDRARQTIVGAQQDMAEYYDRNVVDNRIKVGNLVRRKVHVTRNRNPKFAARYEGIYRVQGIDRNNAKLQPWGKGPEHQRWIPLVDLKVYRGNWNHPAPEPSDREDVQRDESHRQPAQCPTCGVHGYEGDWIQCDRCRRWHHMLCVGLTEALPDEECWYCDACEATTWERGPLDRHADDDIEARIEDEQDLGLDGIVGLGNLASPEERETDPGEAEQGTVEQNGDLVLAGSPAAPRLEIDSPPRNCGGPAEDRSLMETPTTRTAQELGDAVVLEPDARFVEAVPCAAREEVVGRDYLDEQQPVGWMAPLQESETDYGDDGMEPTDQGMRERNKALDPARGVLPDQVSKGAEMARATGSPAARVNRPLDSGMTRHHVRLLATPGGVVRYPLIDASTLDEGRLQNEGPSGEAQGLADSDVRRGSQ